MGDCSNPRFLVSSEGRFLTGGPGMNSPGFRVAVEDSALRQNVIADLERQRTTQLRLASFEIGLSAVSMGAVALVANGANAFLFCSFCFFVMGMVSVCSATGYQRDSHLLLVLHQLDRSESQGPRGISSAQARP
jgi:hypothetical protein